MALVIPHGSEFRGVAIAGGWSKQNKYDDFQTLETALQILRHDTARIASPPDLQLVVQFCDQQDYPSWASAWRRSWATSKVLAPTLEWPAELPVGHVAALLLPLAAGDPASVSTRDHVPLFEPLLVHALLPEGVGARDLGLNLILRWIASRKGNEGARLAPPILELTQRGRVRSRLVETYGVSWDLQAASEVT